MAKIQSPGQTNPRSSKHASGPCRPPQASLRALPRALLPPLCQQPAWAVPYRPHRPAPGPGTQPQGWMHPLHRCRSLRTQTCHCGSARAFKERVCVSIQRDRVCMCIQKGRACVCTQREKVPVHADCLSVCESCLLLFLPSFICLFSPLFLCFEKPTNRRPLTRCQPDLPEEAQQNTAMELPGAAHLQNVQQCDQDASS